MNLAEDAPVLQYCQVVEPNGVERDPVESLHRGVEIELRQRGSGVLAGGT